MNISNEYVIKNPDVSVGGWSMVMRVRQAFARGFGYHLKLHGLNQREFAEKFSAFVGKAVDETTVSRWASGDRSPRDQAFDDICRFFNAEPSELLSGGSSSASQSISALPDGRIVIDLKKLADDSGFKLIPKDS